LLSYFVGLGSKAAAQRRAEIDQMCAHLSLATNQARSNHHLPSAELRQREGLDLSIDGSTDPNPNAIDNSIYPDIQHTPGPQQGATADTNDAGQLTDVLWMQYDALFNDANMTDIVLEGENHNLYSMYHDPKFSFTGVEYAAWEELERRTAWAYQS
jgi:hypothetical protein